MAVEGQASELGRVVVLLAAAVVAVPLFRRLGLGSVLGYLAAGLVIGPFGLRLFTHPEAILHVAELGVVLFLFVVGLEMQPSHLWKLRKQIFGLGVLQLVVCGVVLTFAATAAGLPPVVAFVGAMGLAMTSTAIVMQILDERGDLATPRGQRIVSILLLEDLAIVPLLAFVAFVAPAAEPHRGIDWAGIAIGLGSIAGLVLAGRLLSPMFRVLAAARAREVMTAAALLVVLGAALLMEWGGLSMAMGAFLAGVLLSESTFRHQLEADVEPFRGILLGLFFMSVGMSFDVSVFAHAWAFIVAGVVVLMIVKAVAIYAVARFTHTPRDAAIWRAALMAQGSEFAFVLYAAAGDAGVLSPETNATLTAIVILSMALTPVAVTLQRRFERRRAPSMDGIDRVEALGANGGATGDILLIGFGRFGQVVSQSLLARGCDVTIIDTDTEMIRSAAGFGFKVYYGDGTRLDVLRAAGAERARAIAVCVDSPDTATRIVALVKSEFPHAKLLVRAFDRAHVLKLIAAGVDYQVRETFESAMAFGGAALQALGVSAEEAATIVAEVRRRDAQRVQLELTGGVEAGKAMILGNVPMPTPLTPPRTEGRALSDETAEVTGAARAERSTGDGGTRAAAGTSRAPDAAGAQ